MESGLYFIVGLHRLLNEVQRYTPGAYKLTAPKRGLITCTDKTRDETKHLISDVIVLSTTI